MAEAGSHAGDTAGDAAAEAVDVESQREQLLNLVADCVGGLVAAQVDNGCTVAAPEHWHSHVCERC